MNRILILLTFSLILPATAVAQRKPDFVPAIPNMAVVEDVADERGDQFQTKLGSTFIPGPGRTLRMTGQASKAEIIEAVANQLAAARFVELARSGGETITLTARRIGKVDEAWVAASASEGDLRLRSVRFYVPGDEEIGGLPGAQQRAAIALPLPKPVGEVTAADGDIPFLLHLPGGEEASTTVSSSPMVLQVGARQLALDGPVVEKRYRRTLENSSIHRGLWGYRQGLLSAGWTILFSDPGVLNGITRVQARYLHDGRDLIVDQSFSGEGETFRVVDSTSVTSPEAMGRQLASPGDRVSLVGIHFDDQGVLLPFSEPLVERIVALLSANPELRLRIEQHIETGKLARGRALAGRLRKYLESKGISGERLEVEGIADLSPEGANAQRLIQRVDLVRR